MCARRFRWERAVAFGRGQSWARRRRAASGAERAAYGRVMEITSLYQKKRRDFGRPTDHFTSTQPELLEAFAADPRLRHEFVERNPNTVEIQACQEMSEHEVNTESVTYRSIGVLHQEGGWPKDVDPAEKEQTQRYRKHAEKDEEYIRQVVAASAVMEHSIMQNIAVDIYEEYDDNEERELRVEPPSARTLSVFKDPNAIKRTVCDISWHPDGGKKVAGAYAVMQFQHWRMDTMSNISYIWDVNNPNEPEQELTTSSALCCLQYNPRDPHLLVGGCYNGLVSYWDTRKGSGVLNPVDSSILERSHCDPVYDVAWLPGKSPNECASTSTDGEVLWWDIRKLGEPLERLALEEKSAPGSATDGRRMGGVCIEYSAAAGPTKFLVGTEQGRVVSCNRKAKNPSDRIGCVYEGHSGPVYALARNPFLLKFFLTIGDWTARLWNEDIRTPIFTSKCFESHVLDAAWSPTRPGVWLTSKEDGTVDVWDYMHKQNEPTLSLQVDSDGIHTIKMHEGNGLVAAGSVDGSIYMVELSEGLKTMQPNEKQAMQQMLERESKREKNLEARAKELRQKEKRASEMKAADGAADLASWEEQLKTIEADFWKSVQTEEERAPASDFPIDDEACEDEES